MKTKSLNALPIQKKINMEKVPKQYKQVAQGMETQFINHMLGEMRKSIQKSKPDSSAESYYNSLQDYERSKIMAETKDGIGLKEMILKDLLPPHLLNQATTTPKPKQEQLKQYKNTQGQVAINKTQGDHE